MLTSNDYMLATLLLSHFWMKLVTCWSGTASLSLHLLLGTWTGLPGALSRRSSPLPELSLPKSSPLPESSGLPELSLPKVSPPPPLLSFARARSSKFLTESNLQKNSFKVISRPLNWIFSIWWKRMIYLDRTNFHCSQRNLTNVQNGGNYEDRMKY